METTIQPSRILLGADIAPDELIIDEVAEPAERQREETPEDREHRVLLEMARAWGRDKKAAKQKVAKPVQKLPKKEKKINWITGMRKALKKYSGEKDIDKRFAALVAFEVTVSREGRVLTDDQKYIYSCIASGREDLIQGQHVVFSSGIFIVDEVDVFTTNGSIQRVRLRVHSVSDPKVKGWGDLYDISEFKGDKDPSIVIPSSTSSNAAISILLEGMNKYKTDELTNVKRQLATEKKHVRSYLASAERARRSRELLRQRLSAMSDSLLGGTDLLNELEQIQKHSLVEEVYLSNYGNIFIKTKMLNLISRDTMEDTGIQLGQMLFRYSYSSRPEVMAHNLSYDDSNHHGHPNLKHGKICRGENEIEINNMFKAQQLYVLTDFLITFFTLYPQDGGDPFIGFESWLEERRKNTSFTPYNREEVKII